MAEQKWSCGCYEVDGKLAVECTQKTPERELLAHHALNAPYSKVCFRKPKAQAEVASEASGAVFNPEPTIE